jgi:two-component sensor histidine kinase
MLAVVQALAGQIGRRSASLKEFQTQFSQRLQGLSRSIDLLVEEDGCGVLISDLVRSHLEPFGGVDGAHISATGPELLLNPEAAQNIGLALHELATNAIKHGALSVPEGVITVHWELETRGLGPARFRLKWEERNGPEVMPPTRQGFGHIVLQRMTSATLQGKVDHKFDPHGVSWTLEAPEAAVMAREPRERVCELRFAMRNHAVIGGLQATAAH